MCAFRPCISFTPKNTRHRSPTDLCNAVENQAAGLFFIYRFVLSLQEGRRPSRPGGRRAPLISIHAPARGATWGAQRGRSPSVIFQFTPLREGRQERHRLPVYPDYFNSRPCERGDRGRHPMAAPPAHISIHAPARGATTCRSSCSHCRNCYFNSRPCERGDGHRHSTVLIVHISIHAPARGAT